MVDTQKPLSPEEDIHHNKDIAGLSYIPPICLFVYMFRKDSPFIQENAQQGVMLFAFLILGWIFAAIPVVGIVGWIVLIVSFVFMIMGFLKAFNDGQKVRIPFITDYLSKHKIEDIFHMAQDKVQHMTQQHSNTQTTNTEQNVPENTENIIQSSEESNSSENIDQTTHS